MKLHKVFALGIAALASLAFGQKTVRCPLPDPSEAIQADLYGAGTHGVVLAHGGRFTKEGWKRQAQVLADSGFLVLSVRFRGDRLNSDGSPGSFGDDADNATDVLAATSCLRRIGATTVFAVGASMGGDAVGEASTQGPADNIARIVLLGSSGGNHPEKLRGRKLFIVAREDRSASGLRLGEISSHYAKAPDPKKLVVLRGTAHAQFLFDTDQGTRLLQLIRDFLSDP